MASSLILLHIYIFWVTTSTKMTQRAQRNRANDPLDLDFVVPVVVRCELRDLASDSLFGLPPYAIQ